MIAKGPVGGTIMATGKIEIALSDPGKLLGVRGLDIQIDGEQAGSIGFGETKQVECAPGSHQVRILLHAVVHRRSNVVTVEVGEDRPARLHGDYSRLWGTVRLKPS
jgi:hypothetical protein